MGPARIYPWRKMHRSRAPSIAPSTFFVAQSWADYITNMPGFNLRQAQVLCLTYNEGGSDCSFTSYAECLEAESGIGAVCFDNIAISLTTAKGLEFKAIINMNREPNAT